MRVDKYRSGWAVFNGPFRITGAMSKAEARRIKRELAE